jgi:hypothetical protein
MPPTEAGAVIRPGAAAPRPVRSGSTRATPVVLIAVAGALLVVRIALGVYEHVRPAERANLVEWRDPVAGEAEARAAGRLALYYFTRDGVPDCRKMNREMFGDLRLAAAINAQLVPIRVLDLVREEGRNPPDVVGLEQKYGVTVFPTLVVAIPGQPRFQRQVGYAGVIPTRQFLSEATARLMMPERMRARPDSGAALGR